MIIQAGGKIIERNAEGDLDSYLGAKDENDLSPAQAALRFYTEFADPSKKRYSWNKSLPNSRDMFAQGDSAMYIGSASEIETLQEKNPNLNFDVAPLPKIRPNENVQIVTTGTIYVLAIPRAAKNPEGANTIAKIISSGAASELLESLLLIPSPQRVLLSPLPNDAIRSSFRAAAVQMRVWPDPDPDASRDILYNMISRVVTGVDRLSESVQRADAEMKILLRDTQ
jgi:ABC-type glycerol-3-phosphate transport system substrate-binding protein